VQVRLLGPVDVAVEGRLRPVNGLWRKAVLATLALHDGQVVSTDRLVDVVWGRSAPLTVVNALPTHISYPRGVLGSRDAIVARAPGYLLNLGGDGTDARAAERLLAQGRRPTPPRARRTCTQPVPVPAQLPPAVPGFAGRRAELARLDAVLAQAQRGPLGGSAAVVISAVSGTAGVGKTALAVHWAHRVAPQFPDGQFYVSLRGFGPGGQPAEPGEVIRGFLDALGVPAERIPDGVQAQAALYRILVAGKRMLLVLDDAHDPGQVRPLLPGSPGCLVLMTSRSDLAGLVAAEGAGPVSLDLLTTAEASDLLAWRLGQARVASDPQAVREIIDRCARLPLALSIAAASLAATSVPQARVLLAELTSAHLVTEPSPGRYSLHDLLRAYATEQVNSLLPGAARAAASRRIFDHYLHTAYIAARLLKPERDPIDLADPARARWLRI
jgi:NB-ARC domain-containing protein